MPPTTREKLRDQFLKHKQLTLPVVVFEVAFTGLSRVALELVVTEEWHCIVFEKRLRAGLLFKVAGSMIRDYGRLLKAVAHLETVDQVEKERMRGSRRSQEVNGESQDSKRQRGTTLQQS